MSETSKKLPKTVRIRRGMNSRFELSRHVEFHRRQYDIVADVNAEKLLLTADMLKAWKASIQVEENLNKQAQASAQTAEMLKKDHERDRLLSMLFGVVRAYLNSHIDLMLKSAVELNRVLRPYYGIQERANDMETADVVGMLTDLEPLADEITALGMTPVVTELKTVNEAYEQLMKERVAADIGVKLPSSKKIRPETDEQFAVICQHIEAAYIVAKTDEDRTMIFNLAEKMNRASDVTQTAHSQGQAQKKLAKEKKAAEKELKKLLPAFEASEGFAPHSLTLTGKTAKGADHAKLYELVSLSGESVWVKVEGGKLVKVPAPAATD